MRTLSPRAIEAGNASQTDEVWLACLTIRHADITPGGAIRVVNDFADIVRTIDGVEQTYIGFPFEITLPDDDPDGAPMRAQIRIDNVDQRIVEGVRGLTGDPPMADVEVILASQPNTVEVAYYDLTMRAATFDSLYVEADLTVEQIFVEPICEQMTPERFPGMF